MITLTRLDMSKPLALLASRWSVLLAIAVYLAGILVLFDHRWHGYFLPAEPYGDEWLFRESFEWFLAHGWYDSVARGSAPLFNLAAWFFFLWTGDSLQSLRLVSIAALIGMVLAWWWYARLGLRVRGILLWSFLVFLVGLALLRNTFFSGVNDPLFALFISLGFIFLASGLSSDDKRLWLFALSGLSFAAALAVRELFALYVPGILLMVAAAFAMLRQRWQWRGPTLAAVTFVIATGLIHAPALIEKGQLSWYSKEHGNGLVFVQAYWLNSLHRLEGKPPPTWDDVREYLQIHGAESLPRGHFEAIFKDPAVTWSSFKYNLYYSIKPFFRHTFLFFLVFLIYPIASAVLRWPLPDWYVLGAVFFLAFLLTFALVHSNAVEFRRYMVFPFLVSTLAIGILGRDRGYERLAIAVLVLNMLVIGFANVLLFQIW